MPLLVPRDMQDGVLGAYWCRPEAYLDPAVRANCSGLALADPAVVARGVAALGGGPVQRRVAPAARRPGRTAGDRSRLPVGRGGRELKAELQPRRDLAVSRGRPDVPYCTMGTLAGGVSTRELVGAAKPTPSRHRAESTTHHSFCESQTRSIQVIVVHDHRCRARPDVCPRCKGAPRHGIETGTRCELHPRHPTMRRHEPAREPVLRQSSY